MLTILVVHPRYCVRATKQIEALIDAGNSVVLLTKKGRVPGSLKLRLLHFKEIRYKNFFIFRFYARKVIRKLIKDFSIDIIHSHNEPNYHVLDAIIAADGEIPVIYDVHDLTSLREGKPNCNEELCFKMADGIVYSSEAFQAKVKNVYDSKPSITIYSTPLLKNYINSKRRKNSNLKFVYQGGIIDKSNKFYKLMIYRDYSKIFNSILEEGIELHVYGAQLKSNSEYHKLAESDSNFILHDRIPYKELIQELGQYDFGIAGFNMDNLYNESTEFFLNAVMPNKPFDYLFAGIPCIVYNGDMISKIVEKYNFGVRFNGNSWRTTAESAGTFNLRKAVSTLAMDNQMPKLSDFYNKLIRQTLG